MPRTSGVRATLLCPHVLRSGLPVFKQARLLPYALCFFVFLITNNSFLIDVKAQNGTATLSGTVTDPNGALIPGVNIAVINIAQGFQRHTMTNGDGNFVVSALSPNTYTVKAEHEGFKTAEYPDVVLNVNSQRRIDIQLKLAGPAGTTVDVVENAPLVRDSPEIGTVVDRQFVGNMPLNGRSVQPLITLTPGVVLTATDLNGNEPGQFSVNGQRANANYFMVDGVGVNVSVAGGLVSGELTGGSLPALAATGGTNNLVSIDALQEFKVQTSTYAAEFGRTPGGQISIVTRAGTNDFHGSLFDYFRNDLFDANDWFNNLTGQHKPATRQHDFGGVLGGPVLFPHFGEGGSPLSYNGRNKTHFFFSYEGLRLRQPQSAITFVPSLSARAAAPAAIRPYLNAFPIPNGPENSARFAQFAASFSNPLTLDATSLRIDHLLGNSMTLFGRYNYSPSKSVQRGGNSSLNTLGTNSTTTQTLTVGGTIILTPVINNEWRFNYSHVTGGSFFDLDSFGGAVVPSDSLLFTSFAPKSNSQFSLILLGANNAFLNVGTAADNLQRQINVIDNLSLAHGSHSFKFGVDYRRLLPVFAPRAYALSHIFNGVNGALTGRTLQTQINADFFSREPIYDNLSLFGQDSWKISRRLTLSYGLRWELNTAPHERNGNEPRTVTGFDSPSTTVLAPEGTPLYKTTYNNFAPRIGFVYQLRENPGSETILRGGFGVFYDVGNGETSSAFGSSVFPFGTVKRTLNVALPLSLADATPTPIGPVPSQATILAFEQDFKLPYTLQYSFGIEQAFGPNESFSVSYVGARGRRLLRREGFQAPPQFGSVGVIRNAASSDFDSLQAQYQRRLSRGLQALASYTFSKSLDNASSESAQFVSITRIDPSQDRGPSDFDFRHTFSAAVSYSVPGPDLGTFANAIFHDWAIDSIVKANSAPPVNILSGVTLLGVQSVARPDLILGVPVYIDDETAPGGRRINRNAFMPVPQVGGALTRQGSLGRNSLRGLPLFQLDLTFRRQFKLTDRVKLQFRTDFFNILNHPNFGSVCANLSTCGTQFGLATRMFGKSLGSGGIASGFNPLYQIGGPRSTQFSLKFEF